MIEIVPAIIAKTNDELVNLIKKLEPHTTRVSIDVMDGIFVPNKTVSGYEELPKIETTLAFDAHLMIQNPENQMADWLKTAVDRFFIHVESSQDLRPALEQIRQDGKKAGIVLNPETSLEKAIEYIDYIDYIQFMTVQPGFYGGTFIEQVIPKISEFHASHPQIQIIVDGGIVPATAKLVKDAGASILISGSYVLNSPDITQAIKDLQDA